MIPRKGWVRRCRAWRETGAEGDVPGLVFQWDEFVVPRAEVLHEWSNYDENTNALLAEAFAANPGSTVELNMKKHGQYTVVLPGKSCASKDSSDMPEVRPELEDLKAGKHSVFGNQFSHKSQQTRIVRAIPAS